MTEHPYKAQESSPMWAVLDNALSELETNDDIKITTHRAYVIGFLVKRMQENLPPKTNASKASL
jgi:hypothetical protein